MEIQGLSKSILDASWGKFANFVLYKAENAGKYAVHVIAKGTTQDCSVCGKTVPKDLSVRIHSCPYCGSVMPRDYNAASEYQAQRNRNGRVGHTRTRLSQYREAKYACRDKNLYSGRQQSRTSFCQRNKNLPALAVESVNIPDRVKRRYP